MPRRLSREDATPPAGIGHNSAEQDRIIKQAVDRIIALKAERAAIGEQITEEKAKVKALGIKMKAFNVGLNLTELEIEDRNQSIDDLKRVFGALGLGAQGELFPTVASPAGPVASSDAPVDPTAANKAGMEAGLAGKNRDTNPYPERSELADYFDRGWMAGQKQLAANLAKKPKDGTAAGAVQ